LALLGVEERSRREWEGVFLSGELALWVCSHSEQLGCPIEAWAPFGMCDAFGERSPRAAGHMFSSGRQREEGWPRAAARLELQPWTRVRSCMVLAQSMGQLEGGQCWPLCDCFSRRSRPTLSISRDIQSWLGGEGSMPPCGGRDRPATSCSRTRGKQRDKHRDSPSRKGTSCRPAPRRGRLWRGKGKGISKWS
jgi:hypothetical protein